MRGYGNIEVAHGSARAFTGYLDDAGIVLIDFPSTTLLQAIAAGKTVFVLTRQVPLLPEALALLRKRVYCSPDIGEFTSLVQGYLDGKTLEQDPDPSNTEFLERYGVGELDGGITGRVLGVLDELQKREVPRSP